MGARVTPHGLVVGLFVDEQPKPSAVEGQKEPEEKPVQQTKRPGRPPKK